MLKYNFKYSFKMDKCKFWNMMLHFVCTLGLFVTGLSGESTTNGPVYDANDTITFDNFLSNTTNVTMPLGVAPDNGTVVGDSLQTTPQVTTTFNTTLHSSLCHEDLRPCRHNGTCVNGTCSCLPRYTGTFCELPVECDRFYCNINNTANCTVEQRPDEPLYGFHCSCLPFYKGERCETYDWCKFAPCHNRGECHLKPDNSNYWCKCSKGDPNQDCLLNEVNECFRPPPASIDNIITCIDKIGGKDLLCAPNYTGDGCSVVGQTKDFCTTYGQDSCTDEGYCKAHCNVDICINGTANCNFTTKAYEDFESINKTICKHYFANGIPDDECNKEETLFDGFDSVFGGTNNVEDCSPFFNTICTERFGNGECDPQCQTRDCLWDGWDCPSSEGVTKQLSGGVVVEFKTLPEDNLTSITKLSLLSRSYLMPDFRFQPVPHVFLKVNSSSFTNVKYVARFLSGTIAKLPFLMDNVTDVYVCEPGTYSAEYDDKCGKQCSNCTVQGDICYWNNGTCIHGCQRGNWGSNCQKHCPPLCAKDCDSSRGFCLLCPEHKYGGSCENTCDKHCQNQKCDPRTGACVCLNGKEWRQERCTCPHGFYGDMCSKECVNCHDKTCNDLTGACIASCISGFHGLSCNETCSDGCKSCDRWDGTCPDPGDSGARSGEMQSDNTGVIIGVVVSIVLVVVFLLIACCYWRRRQSGDYIVDDEDGEQGDYHKKASHHEGEEHAMVPASPLVGKSTDMIDMDEKSVTVVYAGPQAPSLASTSENDAGKPEPGSDSPRQPADGDSEVETELGPDKDSPVGGAPPETDGKYATGIVIEVDKRGRVMSITSADQIPSPTSLTHDDAGDDDVLPEPEDSQGTPPHSPIGTSMAPLASEENILAGLGARTTSTSDEPLPPPPEEEVTEEPGSPIQSRKSSTSSSSSSSSSSGHSKHSSHSDRDSSKLTTEM